MPAITYLALISCNEYESNNNPNESDCMNTAFIDPIDEVVEDETSQCNVLVNTTENSEQISEALSNNLILHKFNNPPMRNLCFSNVVVTCLLNVPILRTYLQEKVCTESRSIIGELSNLSRKKSSKQHKSLKNILSDIQK